MTDLTPKEQLAQLNQQLEALGQETVALKPGKTYASAVDIAEDRLEQAQAKAVAPKNKVIKAHCSFDPGNRSTILFNGENLVSFRSAFVDLPGRSQPDVEDKDSKIITIYSSDSNSHLKNHRYYFGKGATFEPNYIVVFEGDLKKIEDALFSLLPCVAAMFPGAEEVELTLNVNVTDTARDLPTLKKVLLGITEFEFESLVTRVNVKSVRAFSEGLGVWKIAKDKGLVSDNEQTYTGVVNLGGSTADGLIITSEGQVLKNSSFTSDKLGTYELANAIRRVLKSQGVVQAIKLDRIMDALEKRRYDLTPQISIEDIYQDCVDAWFDNILAKVTDAWTPQLSSMGLFILTGGSVNLIVDRLEGNDYWLITDDCVNDNVVGIHSL